MAETTRRRGRPKKPAPPPQQKPVHKELPPKNNTYGGSWINQLLPLTQRANRGHYFLVYTFDSPTKATSAQKNMTGRNVHIPFPDHDWTFNARGCELYAIYRGAKRPKR